ncbi:hypothetical protein HN51_033664 [Arachis hypogaea]
MEEGDFRDWYLGFGKSRKMGSKGGSSMFEVKRFDFEKTSLSYQSFLTATSSPSASSLTSSSDVSVVSVSSIVVSVRIVFSDSIIVSVSVIFAVGSSYASML